MIKTLEFVHLFVKLFLIPRLHRKCPNMRESLLRVVQKESELMNRFELTASNSSKPANVGERDVSSRRRRSLDARIYAGASLTYKYAMIIAKGKNEGTRTPITPKLLTNIRRPWSTDLAELFKAPVYTVQENLSEKPC
jgi:hypothetical protein